MTTKSKQGCNVSMPEDSKQITCMRTRRPFPINNSLCHGICNYNCRLCGVNKKSYSGPIAFQERAITERLIELICRAGAEEVPIRLVANAGDGEPTLHPDFAGRMTMFGDMLRAWDAPVPAPEVTIVTNGSRLTKDSVWPALVENPITVNISFPTCDPNAYGEIMFGDGGKGEEIFSIVSEGIRKVMAFRARDRVSSMNFHVSPPERDIIRRDFDRTVDFLTQMAASVGLGRISLIMFPTTTNRSGLVRNRIRGMDTYKDLYRKYNKKRVNDVLVGMKPISARFFHSFGEILDLIRAYDFPCLWNSNLFVTAEGDVTCANDQAVRNPFGHIMRDDLVALMHRKETFIPCGRACPGCDASPLDMCGSAFARFMSLASRLRVGYARRKQKRS